MTEPADRGYSTSDVYKYLKAAVEMAAGPDQYQHAQLGELHNNIVDYATKKISAIRPPSVKVIVTCTIVQNTDAGFHISNSTHWDDDRDSLVTYQFQNKSMTVVVTAYLVQS
ncbi:hypothetical protein IWW55_002379 [Coemansia sp. RSA 2706]|nr:hypothetical protein LPJ63_003956 [Coemansia sp. RSA 2711]KAJ2304533.1 hypothetical protein IWW55_002379 [Coemansia sp. RSA 2706]KAJ2306678.1 hypothetical protein IWW52_006180 [Coemansia sp. RSA 2704]